MHALRNLQVLSHQNAMQATISHKCSPPSSSLSAVAEFTEVELSLSAGRQEVRRQGITAAEAVLEVALRASANSEL